MAYLDLVIFIVLLIVVILVLKKFHSVVMYVALFDIALRIINFLVNNIKLEGVSTNIANTFSENIPHMIARYSDGGLRLILSWIFFIVLIIFFYYTFDRFWHRKR